MEVTTLMIKLMRTCGSNSCYDTIVLHVYMCLLINCDLMLVLKTLWLVLSKVVLLARSLDALDRDGMWQNMRPGNTDIFYSMSLSNVCLQVCD